MIEFVLVFFVRRDWTDVGRRASSFLLAVGAPHRTRRPMVHLTVICGMSDTLCEYRIDLHWILEGGIFGDSAGRM